MVVICRVVGGSENVYLLGAYLESLSLLGLAHLPGEFGGDRRQRDLFRSRFRSMHYMLRVLTETKHPPNRFIPVGELCDPVSP